MSDKTVDQMMAELASEGIVPQSAGTTNKENSVTFDRDTKIIQDLEMTTGVRFSDEQRNILLHHGNACILACAGSGKTSICVNLIAKRIMSGEILDTKKLIYTTYSKAGAVEMKDRLDRLLRQLGINKEVQVRTLHSFFLQVLRIFGVSNNIIDEKTRSQFVREACKEAEFTIKDDDLMVVDNLLSYQVNYLLSDKKTIDACVNTLEDLTLDQYTKIRMGYATRKAKKNLIDYDDMQSMLYLWLVKWSKSTNPQEVELCNGVRNYCQAMYTDFFIDEAQDVSKIQFAIIRAIVTDPNDKNKLVRNLVFIGDDDQCLLGSTVVKTVNGPKLIKDIKVGDKIISYNGSKVENSTVVEVESHPINVDLPLVKFTTESGKSYTSTANHLVMVKIPDDLDYKVQEFDYMEYPHSGNGVKTSAGYIVTRAITVCPGMLFGRINEVSNTVHDDRIVSVEKIDNISEYEKNGERVYCINLASNNNYFANGLLTHNCIYTWRGSDPSIILSIGPMFNMQTFVLSTNYRCKSEIVDYATTGIKCNSSRYQKSMSAHVSGGSVKILQSDKEDLCSLSSLALDHIKYWLSHGDTANDIAVLSRNNFHLALLSNMLLREGIYCNMTADMKLTKSYMYKDIKILLDFCKPNWNHNDTATIMWKLCRFLGVNGARVISEFQNTSSLSLEDALGFIVSHFIDKNVYFNKKLGITLQAEERLNYYIGTKLTSDTKNDIKAVYHAITCGNESECFTTLSFLYKDGAKFLYRSRDKARSINGLTKYISNILEADGYTKTMDFLRVTEQLESGTMVIPGAKVTLTTIHSAKGREWKDVIMFACDNVSQPSFDGIRGMLDDGINIHDIFANLDEERRLFYVGNTRAKENLMILTYGIPSIFILEALGILNEKDGNNGKIIELVEDDTNSWYMEYRQAVNDKIQNVNSKYYYDKDIYKA